MDCGKMSNCRNKFKEPYPKRRKVDCEDNGVGAVKSLKKNVSFICQDAKDRTDDEEKIADFVERSQMENFSTDEITSTQITRDNEEEMRSKTSTSYDNVMEEITSIPSTSKDIQFSIDKMIVNTEEKQSGKNQGQKAVKYLERKGRVIDVVKSLNLSLYEICLACYKKASDFKRHPILNGSICDDCCETLLLGFILDEEKTEHCFVCGKSHDSLFKCSNQKCEINGIYCERCINELCEKRVWDVIWKSKWLCFYCDKSKYSPLEIHEDWIKNICLLQCKKVVETPIIPRTEAPIRVLSLFDGIGSGFVALKQLGIAVGVYFASEIDQCAMNVASANSQGNIHHIGDITALTISKLETLGSIDLLLGGSPCTELSLVNPARRGLFDIKSSGRLFFEYLRVLDILKSKNPNILFLFENTASMPNNIKSTISRFLDCQPILLDSKLFCPMRRARYFWGNIPDMENTKRILTSNKKLDYFITGGCDRSPSVSCIRTVTTNWNSLLQGFLKQPAVIMRGKEDSLWISELEKLFGFKEHYTDVGNYSPSKRLKLIGNSWCVHVICHLLDGLKMIFLPEDYERN